MTTSRTPDKNSMACAADHPTPEQLRQLAVSSARIGGQALLEWRGKFTSREKGPADLVTDADLASQEAVRRRLLGERPDDLFVGEESGDEPKLETKHEVDSGRVCWVVDPLDGTVNYVHGFPAFATSVAAVVDGRSIAGAVFDPIRGETFSASRGGGAWLGDSRLSTSDATALEHALVAISLPPRVTRESPDVETFLDVLGQARAVRRNGSAALNLAYVAAGRLDANWAHVIYPWDAAAGVLIAEEAGAAVSNCSGAPFDVWRAEYLVSATASLHRQLLAILAGNST